MWMYLKPDGGQVGSNGIQPLQNRRHWQSDDVAEGQGRQLAGCRRPDGIKLVQPPVQKSQQELLARG